MKFTTLNIILIMIFSNSLLEAQKIIQLSSADFQKIAQSGKGTLLDVRTESEYDAEHIEGAGQLNYYAFDFRKKVALLPKDQPVYVYCNVGYRSHKAAEILVELGYTEIYNLAHGIMDWNLNEMPVVKGDRSKLIKDNEVSPIAYKDLIHSTELVFIDFYAPWCGPCRQMMPMIDSIATEYKGKVTVAKVNSDVSKKLVKQLELRGVPYFQMFKNGKLILTKSGLLTRQEIEAIFNSQTTSK